MIEETELSKKIDKQFPEVKKMSNSKIKKELKDVMWQFKHGSSGRFEMYYQIALGNELVRRENKLRKVS